MLLQSSFPASFLLPSKNLPLTLISLEDWVLVTVTGVNSKKYLQSQVTCDLSSLKIDQFKFAAHCNEKGKMFSFLYIFYHQEGISFIERRSVCDNQLKELKKYAVFSKIRITTDEKAVLLGVAGFQAYAVLSKFFINIANSTHSATHNQDTTILCFNLPAQRFLLVTTSMIFNVLKEKLANQAQFNNSKQWLALDIEAGYPIIDNVNSSRFIPQSVNLQELDGISFNKGCYIGQEMIARVKYRGINKRTLYWLSGKSSYLPVAGDDLELKVNKGWKRTGTVMAVCRLINGIVWIQAVLMSNNITPNSLLRVCDDETSIFFTCSLPYIFHKK